MKRKTGHKVVVSWVLLATFLFVFLVKDFHSHDACADTSCAHAEDKGDGGECSSCLICHFLFSPFTAGDTAVSFAAEEFSSFYLVSSAEEVPSFFSYSFQLRAPPAVAYEL